MPKKVTKQSKDSFTTLPAHDHRKVQLIHKPCGSVRVIWKGNLHRSLTCSKCSERLPSGPEAYLLVSTSVAILARKIPSPIPSGMSIYYLQPDGRYILADDTVLAASDRVEVIATVEESVQTLALVNPWALPEVAQTAPEPNTGYNQFLAIPSKYTPYLTGVTKLTPTLEEEAEEFTSQYIGEDYLGDFLAGEEWEYEGTRYSYVYVPVTNTATLTPTGLGGSPNRTTTE